MSDKTRAVPLYQRYRDSGVRSHNRAGVQAALKAGDDPTGERVTWNVHGDTLAGMTPAAGDYLRDTAGRWWKVETVGDPTDDVYPLLCARWKDGPE